MRVLLLAMVSLAFVPDAVAEENNAENETITIVHYPNSGTVNGVSVHLGRLLGSDVVAIELPEQNVMLIRVPVDQQEKVTKLLQAIDVPRPMIRYRLVWLYTKTRLSSEQLKTLQGSLPNVRAAIDQLGKDDLVLRKREFESSSLSNTECHLTELAQKVFVAGAMQVREQSVKRTEFIEHGTTIQVMGLATKSNIIVALDAEVSSPGTTNENGELNGDVAEQSIMFQSTVQVKDGDAVLITSITGAAKNNDQNLYLIFGAETVK